MSGWERMEKKGPGFIVRTLTLDNTAEHHAIKVYIETKEATLEHSKRSRNDIIHILMTGERGVDSHRVTATFMGRLVALRVEVPLQDRSWLVQDIEPDHDPCHQLWAPKE